MKKKLTVRLIAEIGIFAALGFVLDYTAGLYSAPLFPNGGSISLAMTCVFVVTFRRGMIPGFIVGAVIGLLNMATGFYAIADVWYKVVAQLALDYWLAYPLVALAGIMRRRALGATTARAMSMNIGVGALFGGLLKFLAHYLSGILFWPGDPWHVGGSYIFSALYNGAYMLPSTILCALIMVLISARWPTLFTHPDGFHLPSDPTRPAPSKTEQDSEK